MFGNATVFDVSLIGERFRQAAFYRGFSSVEECAILLLKLPLNHVFHHLELELTGASTIISSALGIRHVWLCSGEGELAATTSVDWIKFCDEYIGLPKHIIEAAWNRTKYYEPHQLTYVASENSDHIRVGGDPTIPAIEDLRHNVANILACFSVQAIANTISNRDVRTTFLDASAFGQETVTAYCNGHVSEAYLTDIAEHLQWHQETGIIRFIESGASPAAVRTYEKMLAGINDIVMTAANDLRALSRIFPTTPLAKKNGQSPNPKLG